MPTPFYHLLLAESLQQNPGLPQYLRSFLAAHYPAYLLGHVAPDVQVVSGQKRTATHFYPLPVRPGETPPWQRIFELYPELAEIPLIPGDRHAFLAGYLCHLQADWYWAKEIFEPYFGIEATWQSFRERLYLHNVLRAYLDYQVLQSLDGKAGDWLERATPEGWLPFVSDDHLKAWRDLIGNQLHPGAAIQTVEVFAARQGISSQDFYHLLESEQEMDRQIFSVLPRAALQSYFQRLLAEHLNLLETCLQCNQGDFDEG